MFTLLVHSQKIPDVVKLTLLHIYIKKQSADVCNIAISDANYEASRDTLKLFFENERHLVHNHLFDHFAVQPMSAKT